MAKAYYNEIDPKAAAWLRELIWFSYIADGDVDERSIEDVRPADLLAYDQCHFFAGIGGWSLALRLAGWPDSRPVWTGSCPCQPFSTAGEGRGFTDERHLWPAFFHLIVQRRPPVIFGEQVASYLGWLDLIQTDLEGEGYATGAAIIGAHSVGAPHIRQRLYWVANSSSTRLEELSEQQTRSQRAATERGGTTFPLVDTAGSVPGSESGFERGMRREPNQSKLASVWSAVDWVSCRDGKIRPVESGSFPLANGVPSRVDLLRGYGNAIVPQDAAAFIEAYLG